MILIRFFCFLDMYHGNIAIKIVLFVGNTMKIYYGNEIHGLWYIQEYHGTIMTLTQKDCGSTIVSFL